MSQSLASMSQPGNREELFSREVGLRLKSLRRRTGMSRMSREAHVRIGRGLVVKFHRSTWRKRHRERCQVRFREASASELPMRCRNEKDDVRTGDLWDSRISLRGTCLLLGRRPA